MLNKIRLKWIILKFRISDRFFPYQQSMVCANRHTRKFNTDHYEVSFTYRDKRKRDGYEYVEMMLIMDTFLGRKISEDEWLTVIQWQTKEQTCETRL